MLHSDRNSTVIQYETVFTYPSGCLHGIVRDGSIAQRAVGILASDLRKSFVGVRVKINGSSFSGHREKRQVIASRSRRGTRVYGN